MEYCTEIGCRAYSCIPWLWGCEDRRWDALVGVDDEIFANDGDGDTGRTDVLLGTEEDDCVCGNVDGARKDVARAISYEGDGLAVLLGQILDRETWVGELDTVHGLVVAVVEHSRLALDWAQLPLADWRNGTELAVSTLHLSRINSSIGGSTQTSSFLDRFGRPGTSDSIVARGTLVAVVLDIVGVLDSVSGKKVECGGGELLCASTLNEENGV